MNRDILGSIDAMTATAPEAFANATPLERARSGDLDAFNELVIEYQGLVYQVCYRLLGDRQLAEDASQETFISAWRNITRASGEDLKPWLLAIALNRSRDEMRRRLRRVTFSIDGLEEVIRDDGMSPEEAAADSEACGRIGRCMSALPWPQLQVLTLWYTAGLSYEEIASVTSLNLGTVKSRLHRGRMHLARLLRESA